MGVFTFLVNSFMDGWRKGLERSSSETPPRSNMQPAHTRTGHIPFASERDFENRLLRARTEPLVFLRRQFMGAQCISATIHNNQSGNTYQVTATSCECEDFKKRGLPCKHMIYFALKTDNFYQYEKPILGPPLTSDDEGLIPFYGKYYSGIPTGIGYLNLYPYRVIGRFYGTSAKTGRQTNRKREIIVNASSPEDAQAAAESQGVFSPYAEISIIDAPPSCKQLAYLHGVGIPFPFFVTATDVSALLTRYQEQQDDVCPSGLFAIATDRRISVSYFDSPQSVIRQIWCRTTDSKLPALFCYLAYCRESEYEVGSAPLSWKDEVFQSFAPNQKKQLDYIESYLPNYPIRTMSKRSYAYEAAISHIRNQKPWVLYKLQ